MITFAFYKGKGRIFDRLIRFSTGGDYSHVELIAGQAELGRTETCLSASPRDGGVRQKDIYLKPEHWDLLILEIEPGKPIDFLVARTGQRYDWFGIVFSHILALGQHDPRKWFCSEICAEALRLQQPQRYSPQMLYEVLVWRLSIGKYT